jgi:hypothetical protein
VVSLPRVYLLRSPKLGVTLRPLHQHTCCRACNRVAFGLIVDRWSRYSLLVVEMSTTEGCSYKPERLQVGIFLPLHNLLDSLPLLVGVMYIYNSLYLLKRTLVRSPCKLMPSVHTKSKGKVVRLGAMKEGAWGERRYSSHSFLTSAVEGGESSASCPGRVLPPGERTRNPLYRRLGEPRAGVGAEAEGKISASVGNRSPVVEPVDGHYTELSGSYTNSKTTELSRQSSCLDPLQDTRSGSFRRTAFWTVISVLHSK